MGCVGGKTCCVGRFIIIYITHFETYVVLEVKHVVLCVLATHHPFKHVVLKVKHVVFGGTTYTTHFRA